ncbi:hypothetical protein BpHYR1_018201 [Brachionus plicatilis]|uniref:Uncharacterized protein n=1 Tax=Brachionus plicatilis TaxID=10195 RepID=A0A3M7QJE6_BRAPC|nr:hypothetical protein BpHYR1_018201 [Brachionus plicatilis]
MDFGKINFNFSINNDKKCVKIPKTLRCPKLFLIARNELDATLLQYKAQLLYLIQIRSKTLICLNVEHFLIDTIFSHLISFEFQFKWDGNI